MTSPDQESPHAEGRFEIINKLGLHARAASRLVQVASKFPCEVTLRQGDQVANGKSVMGVLLLCGSQGTFVEVKAQGVGAKEAVASIGSLIRDRFGEEE